MSISSGIRPALPSAGPSPSGTLFRPIRTRPLHCHRQEQVQQKLKASSIFTKRFSRRRKSIDLFMHIRRSHAHSSSGLQPPVRNRINVSCMISSASLDDNVMRKAVLYSLLPYCRNSSVAFLSSMPISFSQLALQIYQIFYTLDGQ